MKGLCVSCCCDRVDSGAGKDGAQARFFDGKVGRVGLACGEAVTRR